RFRRAWNTPTPLSGAPSQKQWGLLCDGLKRISQQSISIVWRMRSGNGREQIYLFEADLCKHAVSGHQPGLILTDQSLKSRPSGDFPALEAVRLFPQTRSRN